VYGVAVDEEDRRVDREATRRLRERLRGQGSGGEE